MEYKGKILKYLEQSFGWNARFEDLGILKNKLPYGLMSAAQYSVLSLDDIEIVAIEPSPEDDFRGIRQLAETICRLLKKPIVLILQNIDSYQRRSLIEKRINFIIPDRQIYLPVIGILLTERGLGKSNYNEAILSAVSTAVILYHLTHDINIERSISNLAREMGYSVKTLSLAITELERHGLISTVQVGRKKLIQFPESKRELWDKSFHVMINPVEKHLYSNDIRLIEEIGMKSSDFAMSKISMLAEPQQETYAVYARNPRIKELSLNSSEGIVEVEMWKFDPKLIGNKDIVDVFSLALTYRDDDDPRINIELEKLLNTSLKD